MEHKKTGQGYFFTYKDGNKYTSACLELDIIKEGKKREELSAEMLESVEGYVETICKEKLNVGKLLNRFAPEKYWKHYEQFLEMLEIKRKSERKAKEVVGMINVFAILELCCLGCGDSRRLLFCLFNRSGRSFARRQFGSYLRPWSKFILFGRLLIIPKTSTRHDNYRPDNNY